MKLKTFPKVKVTKTSKMVIYTVQSIVSTTGMFRPVTTLHLQRLKEVEKIFTLVRCLAIDYYAKDDS